MQAKPTLMVTLTIAWPGFFALGALVYFTANVIFAGLYLLQPGSIALLSGVGGGMTWASAVLRWGG
jgi:hypothetical protein